MFTCAVFLQILSLDASGTLIIVLKVRCALIRKPNDSGAMICIPNVSVALISVYNVTGALIRNV